MKRSSYWIIIWILNLIVSVTQMFSGHTNEALFFLTLCFIALSTKDVLEANEVSK